MFMIYIIFKIKMLNGMDLKNQFLENIKFEDVYYQFFY